MLLFSDLQSTFWTCKVEVSVSSEQFLASCPFGTTSHSPSFQQELTTSAVE